jgi:hypothetical protein
MVTWSNTRTPMVCENKVVCYFEMRDEREPKGWEEEEWKVSEPDYTSESFPTNEFNSIDSYGNEAENDQDKNPFHEQLLDEEMKGKRPALPGNAQDTTIDLSKISTPMLASIIFVRSFFTGAVIGGLFGGVQGAVHGFQNRAALGNNLGPVIMQTTVTSARSFGLWLGTYQSSTVVLSRVRHKNDIGNSVVAGFLAGSISTLATRNRSQIIYSGVTSGLLMGVMHAFNGNTTF